MFYGDLLRSVGRDRDTYFLIFLFYIGFCTVGLLNVVTGIFVDSAVCTRTDDEVVEGYMEEIQKISDEFRHIFTEADTNGSGTISWSELKEHLDNPWVRAYFAGLK